MSPRNETLFPVANQTVNSGNSEVMAETPRRRCFQVVPVKAASSDAHPSGIAESMLSSRIIWSPASAIAVMVFAISTSFAGYEVRAKSRPTVIMAMIDARSVFPEPGEFAVKRNSGAGPGNANRASGVNSAANHAA